MSPGQRIETIKLVAKKLAELDNWSEIDLTLRTFGFPWSDQWNGNGEKYGYLMDHLEGGTDEQLTNIKRYAQGDEHGGNEELDIKEITGPWEPQRFKLFMSHITKDKLFISQVKSYLATYGIDGFVAHEDIEPTREWMDEILNGLETCDALAAFITPGYHESLWTDQEVGYCIRRRVLIVPVGLGKPPYGFMGRYQGAQCKDKTPEEVSEVIFNVLRANSKTKTRLFEGMLGNFEDSRSFDTAAARARLLNKIDVWSPELLRRLQAAKENNSQISGSFVAMPIVDSILKKNTF